MSRLTLIERTTETAKPQLDRRGAPRRSESSRSRSTARARPTLRAARPRGHVFGRAVGESPAQWFAGRPRGHVFGRTAGDPLL